MAQQKTILIIDDDNDLRGALMEQLELHQEFKAVEAINATEGLKLAREVRADLILLDVDLPDMDGRETCRLIRKAGVATPGSAKLLLTEAGGYRLQPSGWCVVRAALTRTSP